MIEIKSLRKSYGSKVACNGLDFKINDGELFGLIGPNGAGKSTLFKIMTGIIGADEGDVILNGHSISNDGYEAKKNFVFVSDTPDHFLELKGIEYLNFISDIYNINQNDKNSRIKELIKNYGIESEITEKIKSYSHGMRQKLMVIGALLVNPKIWILDEPMVGLDPKTSKLLKDTMRQHADKGNIVIFSTHVLEVAEKIVDRFAVINNGKLAFIGNMDEIKANYSENTSLEDIFLDITSK